MPKPCPACGQPPVDRPICPVCNKPVIPPEHPGWITLRFFAFLGLLTVMLYGQATHFDETEIKVILAMAVFVAPAMFGGKIIEGIRKAVS